MRTAITALAAFTALALVSGCAAPAEQGLTVTGTVDDTTDTVVVPVLAVAVADVNVGFPDDDTTAVATDPAAALGLGATLRLSSVTVHEGDTVDAGEVVASIDDGTLQAELEVAKADKAAARAQVGVLESAIDKADDKAADVVDARQKVDSAIRKATRVQGQLARAQVKLQKARRQLVANLDAAQDLLANYPPVAPPGIPTPEELKAAIAKMKAGLRTIDANLAKIARAKPQLREGIRKAHAAGRKLDTADDKIADAKAALEDALELARLMADAATIPVDLARVQLDLTELTAPVGGVVTWAASTGDVLAPGATVVAIRPDGPATVTAWLSPAEAAQVCLGDHATISGDWMAAGAGVPATLTRLGTGYQYPPSDVTTDEIHLLRALEAEFSTTSGTLPAGVPVDISITGCHAAAAAETNG